MATQDTTDRCGMPEGRPSLLLGRGASRARRLGALAGRSLLLLVASSSALAVVFIFYYIVRDAIPFLRDHGLGELLTHRGWYPSREPPEFGAMAIFYGSFMVTVGAALVAVPLGVAAAVCLSDVLPFAVRQFVKPVIEILAAIPSVAFGFFALVIVAPLLEQRGGTILSLGMWVVGAPIALLASVVFSDLASGPLAGRRGARGAAQAVLFLCAAALCGYGLHLLGGHLAALRITSGRNALNASVILGLMALPTVVSVSEDALTAVGRELREGSYALGATRAETILRVVIPAARSGILAAVILGVMRALGETMVVLMASGMADNIPRPWYNLLEPVRTLTATIAQDMGEADQVTGSARYHVLFALALCLLVTSFAGNFISEMVVRRAEKRAR